MSSSIADNFSPNIIAAGNGSQTDAFVIPKLSFYNQVGTATTIANSLRLPLAPILTQQYVVINTGAAIVQLYPGVGASIDANTVNLGIAVPIGASVSLIATSATQWYSYRPVAGPDLTLGVTGALTLTASQHAYTFIVSKAAAYSITVPHPNTCGGVKYTFISSAGAANAVAIVATGGGQFNGRIKRFNGTFSDGAATTITLTAVGVVYDRVHLYSNGVTWFFEAETNYPDGITAA